jgi:hypothetical protein
LIRYHFREEPLLFLDNGRSISTIDNLSLCYLNYAKDTIIANDNSIECSVLGPDRPFLPVDLRCKFSRFIKVADYGTRNIITQGYPFEKTNENSTALAPKEAHYECYHSIKKQFKANLFNVCYPPIRNRGGRRCPTLNYGKTKIITVESCPSMLVTDDYEGLFAVPIVSTDKSSEKDLSIQKFCMMTAEDVKELKCKGFRCVDDHNEFIKERGIGPIITLKLCDFMDVDSEVPCSTIIVQHINNSNTDRRSISSTVQNENVEHWERSGVVLSHMTNLVKATVNVNDGQSFYNTMQRTYRGQGFGSRPSAKSLGSNVYQGKFLQ